MYQKMSPNLMVRDVNTSVRFYVECLGFEFVMSVPVDSTDIMMEWMPDQPLAYAMVRAGDVEIMFQEEKSLKSMVACLESTPVGSASLTLYFYVQDVERLRTNLPSSANIVRDLHQTFYGMREFYVQDPNGYTLGFAQPTSS